MSDQQLALHPAQYLGRLRVAPNDVRGMISAVMHMPYPQDPLLYPEYVGLTYLQVALLKQAEAAAAGGVHSLEFFLDRMIGKPAQLNLNVTTQGTYSDFLKEIAKAEGDIVDVEKVDDDEGAELGL